MNQNQKSATPAPLSNFFCHISTQTWPSEPNEQDIQYPIIS